MAFIWWPSGTVSWCCYLLSRRCILAVFTCCFHLLVPSTSNAHPLAISTLNSSPLYLKLSSSLSQTLVISWRYMWTTRNINAKRARGQELCSNMTRPQGARLWDSEGQEEQEVESCRSMFCDLGSIFTAKLHFMHFTCILCILKCISCMTFKLDDHGLHLGCIKLHAFTKYFMNADS